MVCELLPFNCHEQNMLPKTDPKQTSSRSLNLKHIVLFKMEKFKVIKVNIYRLTYICLLVLVTLLGIVASKNFPPCNIFVTSDLKSTSLSLYDYVVGYFVIVAINITIILSSISISYLYCRDGTPIIYL